MLRKILFWIAWSLGTVIAVVIVAAWMIVGGEREILLVGSTTAGHHQIELACETCHAARVFSSTAKATKALNKTCRNCHEKELKAADDSHPRKKFRDPRMAIYWEKLDARLCTVCHLEHRPEIARESAVTVASNFCIACHSEGDQDVRLARSTHSGLTFDTCATAGCHNYHDNRSLYEDFLLKHKDQPWLSPDPVHQLTAHYRSREVSQGSGIARFDAVAPASELAHSNELDEWAGSGHATAGINCVDCHAEHVPEGASIAEVEANWVEKPSLKVCTRCHKQESNTFALGRHGMRNHPKIANPRDPARAMRAVGLESELPKLFSAWIADPAPLSYMTVREARLPMRKDAVHKVMDCGSCHTPHDVNLVQAAVEACASCHNDDHTKAYFDSAHYLLWKAEVAGNAKPGSGVSCATCHMEKIERRGKITTNHNQNDTLRPNEKMIRPVCLDCHGLGFSLNALADSGLISTNFRGKPKVQVESIEWATQNEAQSKQSDRN